MKDLNTEIELMKGQLINVFIVIVRMCVKPNFQLKGLDHENIVQIRAVLGEEKMIVMEYVQNGSLDYFIRLQRDRIK